MSSISARPMQRLRQLSRTALRPQRQNHFSGSASSPFLTEKERALLLQSLDNNESELLALRFRELWLKKRPGMSSTTSISKVIAELVVTKCSAEDAAIAIRFADCVAGEHSGKKYMGYLEILDALVRQENIDAAMKIFYRIQLLGERLDINSAEQLVGLLANHCRFNALEQVVQTQKITVNMIVCVAQPCFMSGRPDILDAMVGKHLRALSSPGDVDLIGLAFALKAIIIARERRAFSQISWGADEIAATHSMINSLEEFFSKLATFTTVAIPVDHADRIVVKKLPCYLLFQWFQATTEDIAQRIWPENSGGDVDRFSFTRTPVFPYIVDRSAPTAYADISREIARMHSSSVLLYNASLFPNAFVDENRKRLVHVDAFLNYLIARSSARHKWSAAGLHSDGNGGAVNDDLDAIDDLFDDEDDDDNDDEEDDHDDFDDDYDDLDSDDSVSDSEGGGSSGEVDIAATEDGDDPDYRTKDMKTNDRAFDIDAEFHQFQKYWTDRSAAVVDDGGGLTGVAGRRRLSGPRWDSFGKSAEELHGKNVQGHDHSSTIRKGSLRSPAAPEGDDKYVVFDPSNGMRRQLTFRWMDAVLFNLGGEADADMDLTAAIVARQPGWEAHIATDFFDAGLHSSANFLAPPNYPLAADAAHSVPLVSGPSNSQGTASPDGSSAGYDGASGHTAADSRSSELPTHGSPEKGSCTPVTDEKRD